MADPDRNDLPYVFPPDKTRWARSPANRILLERSFGSSRTRSLIDFIQAREAELQRQENAFRERLGLHIGDSVERSDDEFDVDED